MKSKFKILLRDDVPAVISIDLYITPQTMVALGAKYTMEELDNIVGQEYQRIVDLLALDEE